MTLEGLLKAKGYSDQEITDLAPMLANKRFRADLEAELSQVDTLRTQNRKLETDLDNYDTWFTKEITPEHETMLKKQEELEVELAAARARLKVHQDRTQRAAGAGGAGVVETEAEKAAAAEVARIQKEKEKTMDPTKYVSADTFQQAYQATGEAISDAIDLADDYRELYGSRLNMKQMRTEAAAAKKPIRQYVEEKFNFSGKRQEKVAAERKAEIDAAVKKREDELALQYAGQNPNMQVGRASSFSFGARKVADGSKQPWEKNETETTQSRVEKAYKKSIERGEVATA